VCKCGSSGDNPAAAGREASRNAAPQGAQGTDPADARRACDGGPGTKQQAFWQNWLILGRESPTS